MKVSVYDHAYERSYKNDIGPGPAAYSEVYQQRRTDAFKQMGFTKQRRKLTQSASANPGPDHYQATQAKDKQILTCHPRSKFSKASRKIDVIKCKSISIQSIFS